MSAYVIDDTINYRVDTEREAVELIEKAKKDGRFTVSKTSTTYKHYKETKTKDEEEFWIVCIKKQFNEVRDPACSVDISYDIDFGSFPSVDPDEEEN